MTRSAVLSVSAIACATLVAYAAADAASPPATKKLSPPSPYELAERGGHIQVSKGFKPTFAKKGVMVAKTGGRSPASDTPSSPAGGPPLFANSQRYRDSGGKPGTGRSGRAAIQTRALLNKDGATDLEITTGVLDNPSSALGNIAKVQLKALSTAGEAISTQNWNDLASGGALKFTLGYLSRRQPIQVQTNVRGVDLKRTDVVTAKDTVYRRPDLAVVKLEGPQKAYVNSAVNFAATVSELNADVGADSDCVLYVDGVEVDRANGIWVDAGGTVSCAFTRTFTTTGTKQLTVKVEDVTPSDWDSANNSATASIEIVEPTVAMNYQAWAYEYLNVQRYKQDYFYRYLSGSYDWNQDYHRDYDYKNRYQNVGIYGWKNGVALNFPVSFTAKETSDSNVVFTTGLSNLERDWGYEYSSGGGTYSYGCVYRAVGNPYVYFYFCTQKATNGTATTSAYTWMQYHRYAGDVTYHSSEYNHYWSRYQGTDYFYTYNYDSSSSYGTLVPEFGSNYGFDVNATDGSTSVTAKADVPLQSLTYYSYSYPWTCDEYSSSYLTYRNCWEHEYKYSYKQGSVYKYDN